MRRAILVTLAAGALTALLAAQAAAAPAVRKGGTLKAMFSTDVDFIDPSLAYYAHSWEIMGATGANLLRFADAEGSAGSRIVPEVAAGFPRVSANGRVYTFTLRRGFRFSNGKPVRAQNFAYAIDRALNNQQQSPAGPFVADIVGAQAVLDGRARHAAGVVVTNGGYGLRITLTKPALRTSSRGSRCRSSRRSTRRSGSSRRARRRRCTRPGRTTSQSWTPNTRLVLGATRTTSATSSRRGPPTSTRFEFDANIALPAQVLRIRAGQSDYGAEGVDPAAHADLARQFGVNRRQYQVRSVPVTYYISMNTTRGLFRDPNVRKAVNLAIDRQAILAQRGYLAGSGPTRSSRPGIPGFRDFQALPLRFTEASLTRAQAAHAGPHDRRAHARRQPRRQPHHPADREVQPREDRDQHGYAAPRRRAAVVHGGPPRRAVRVLPRRLARGLPRTRTTSSTSCSTGTTSTRRTTTTGRTSTSRRSTASSRRRRSSRARSGTPRTRRSTARSRRSTRRGRRSRTRTTATSSRPASGATSTTRPTRSTS